MSDETPPIPTGEPVVEEPEEDEPTLTKEEIAWLRNQMQKKAENLNNDQPVKTEIAVLKLEQPPIQPVEGPLPEGKKLRAKSKSTKNNSSNRKRVLRLPKRA